MLTTLLRRLLLLVLLALLLPAPPPAARGAPALQPPSPSAFPRLTDPLPDPQQPGVLWFAATGHSLRGAFRDYWTRYGGLAQFGYPLTEEFRTPLGPANHLVTVQYFQRARFEQHPENAGTPYAVLLGALGRAFHAPDPPAPPLPAPARYFAATGHTLSGAFLTYWQTQGGLFVYGYPLTEPFPDVNPADGRTYTVQYFERARFEWHPEQAGTAYAVLLGLLGVQLAGQQGYFAGRYPPVGYAVDDSWLAGQIEIYGPNFCSNLICGCSILGIGDYRWQLGGPNWNNAVVTLHIQITYSPSVSLVVVGRRAQSFNEVYECPADPLPPGYVVNQAQLAAAP